MVVLKNWCIVTDSNLYKDPSMSKPYLHGNVYGHSGFEDGTCVDTSSIKKVVDCGSYKEVSTRNTTYTVYPQDVDIEYEAEYPDAFNRLAKKTNFEEVKENQKNEEN